jgi:nifR3 family TIM-barrel protein
MQSHYKNELNQGVPLAGPGEFSPLSIGDLTVWPPVVLAPMAGVTNYPFRSICHSFGAGLYVSEMISARSLVEGREKTLKLADFGPGETPRSLQLYGVDPYYVSEAVKRLVGEGQIDHLDMNFGCPVRKVTRKGGGAAIPLKPRLLQSIVRAAVRSASGVPVTIKFRLGIDPDHLTYLQSGRIAEEEGCAGVGLHARTAADLYCGMADWEAIGDLKSRVNIPVLGNGDIWEGADALRLMRQTRCDGVIVGRGCLGRPWLFRDLADVFEGSEPGDPPGFGEVLDTMLMHAARLADWFGEKTAMVAFRRHTSWYMKGFSLSSLVRNRMVQVKTVEELASLFSDVDREQPFPISAMRMKRGKRGGRQQVALPVGYLDNPDDQTPPADEVERMVSGG